MRGEKAVTLEDIRKEIDSIDSALVPLLVKRMECSEKVAEIKKTTGSAVFDASREEIILNRVRQNSGVYSEGISDIYREILSVSKQLQHTVTNRKSN